MSTKRKFVLENTSFHKLCSYAEDEEDVITAQGNSARKTIRAIVNQLLAEYNTDEEVGENSLARIKKGLIEKFNASKLSAQYKGQIAESIKNQDSLLNLLIWAQNLVATTMH